MWRWERGQEGRNLVGEGMETAGTSCHPRAVGGLGGGENERLGHFAPFRGQSPATSARLTALWGRGPVTL